MSQDDLIATLKAAAEKATPGEWDAIKIRGAWRIRNHEPEIVCLVNCTDKAEQNAEYFAAASPANITLLLNYISTKDALIASLKDSLPATLDRESATTARYDAKIEALEAEISKQNKAEDELLATGEKLAEERR